MRSIIKILFPVIAVCALAVLASGCKKDQSDYSNKAPHTPAVRLVVPLTAAGKENAKMDPVPVGTTIKVTGVYLYNISRVTVNGKPAEIKSSEMRFLHFVVPTLALGTSPSKVPVIFYGAAKGSEEVVVNTFEFNVSN